MPSTIWPVWKTDRQTWSTVDVILGMPLCHVPLMLRKKRVPERSSSRSISYKELTYCRTQEQEEIIFLRLQPGTSTVIIGSKIATLWAWMVISFLFLHRLESRLSDMWMLFWGLQYYSTNLICSSLQSPVCRLNEFVESEQSCVYRERRYGWLHFNPDQSQQKWESNNEEWIMRRKVR